MYKLAFKHNNSKGLIKNHNYALHLRISHHATNELPVNKRERKPQLLMDRRLQGKDFEIQPR